MYSWTFDTPVYTNVIPCWYTFQLPPQMVNLAECYQVSGFEFPQKNVNNLALNIEKNDQKQQIESAEVKKSKAKKNKGKLKKKVKIFPNAYKNIKITILRDFIGHIKRDSSEILLTICSINATISIKQLLQKLFTILATNGRYTKLKKMRQACNTKTNKQFSLIIRIILKKFFINHYLLTILSKKKNKFQYLQASRQLQSKLFSLISP